jgi:ATP-dependent DNA helicase DinG
LASPALADRPTAQRLAATMARAGWAWGAAVCAALGEPERMGGPAGGLDVWTGLPEWQERAPPPPPGDQPVSGAETRARLAALLRFDGAREKVEWVRPRRPAR